MISSLLYILLAIAALSFLIFIHELGHYLMARREGMHVETFSIGFRKPIVSWMHDGTRWQIGWLLFGGYVQIAGMDTGGKEDVYKVPNGFFSKTPWQRIKVALAGPLMNLAFAFLAFSALWLIGGREKPYRELAATIGWVEPKSELYVMGVRPGDIITAYDGHAYSGAKDHLYAPIIADRELLVSGYKVDYQTGEKLPFSFKVDTMPHPHVLNDNDIMTSGITAPANYIIYDKLENGKENPLPEGSPMRGSGIEYGDRIVWVDGELVFSSQQLSRILNDERMLVTIERGEEKLLRRVPRVQIQELKLNSDFKDELADWQFEAHLNNTKLQKLYAIPYNLTPDNVVEQAIQLIDPEKEEKVNPKEPFSALEQPLHPGDKIIAVEGTPVKYAYQLFYHIQEKSVNIIVERAKEKPAVIDWKKADDAFANGIKWPEINAIASTIGSGKVTKSAGDYLLLKTITPKSRRQFATTPEKQTKIKSELLEQKKELNTIKDPEKRSRALQLFDEKENELLLGLPAVQGRKVHYNQPPWELFTGVFTEIWRTLSALVSGDLNPKWISGPVGIVQVVHDYSMVSLKDALFWLGAISLNLGILNLLPIPVLDGGSIMFSLFEMVTRKKLEPQTMEKVVIPFALLLIAFFIFLTFNDLSRLLGV